MFLTIIVKYLILEVIMDITKLKKNAKRLDTLFKVLQKISLIVMIAAVCIFLYSPSQMPLIPMW